MTEHFRTMNMERLVELVSALEHDIAPSLGGLPYGKTRIDLWQIMTPVEVAAYADQVVRDDALWNLLPERLISDRPAQTAEDHEFLRSVFGYDFTKTEPGTRKEWLREHMRLLVTLSDAYVPPVHDRLGRWLWPITSRVSRLRRRIGRWKLSPA